VHREIQSSTHLNRNQYLRLYLLWIVPKLTVTQPPVQNPLSSIEDAYLRPPKHTFLFHGQKTSNHSVDFAESLAVVQAQPILTEG
jgi:hypothetical protein